MYRDRQSEMGGGEHGQHLLTRSHLPADGDTIHHRMGRAPRKIGVS